MASTAKAGKVIGQVRTACAELIELHATVQKLLKRYHANGGQTFLHPFFLNEAGQARTDLDVTEAQVITAVANMQLVYARLDNLLETFVQAE